MHGNVIEPFLPNDYMYNATRSKKINSNASNLRVYFQMC